jgi:hypothetical protein
VSVIEPYESLLLWNVPLNVMAVVCGVGAGVVVSGALGLELELPHAGARDNAEIRLARMTSERVRVGYVAIPY